MEGDYWVVIIVTTIAFCALAAMLLVPIYRFMRTEEEMLEEVTEEELIAEAHRRDLREEAPQG